MDDFITLQDILRVILKRWLIIVITLVATVTTFIIVTLSQTPIYEAKSVLLVKFGREYMHLPAIGNHEAVVNRNLDVLFNTTSQILKSRSLIEKVIDFVGIASLYPELAIQTKIDQPMARAVQRFYGNYSVHARPDSEVIWISFRHPQSDMTSRVVNLLVAFYKEAHLQTFSNSEFTAFLGVKIDDSRKNLEAAEEAIHSFQVEHHMLSLDDPDLLRLLRQRERLEQSLMVARHMVNSLQQKLAYLERMDQTAIAESYATLDPPESNLIYSLRARLLQLQLMQQRFLGRFRDMNPRVLDVDNQIGLLEAFLKDLELQAEESTLHQMLQTDIINTSTQLQIQQNNTHSLQKQINQLDKKIQDYQIQQKIYRNLIRERDFLKGTFKTSLRRYEEARSFEEMNRKKIANISVIQEALTPRKPIRPRKKANMAVGVFLGIAIGVGLAFWVDSAHAPKAQRLTRPRYTA